ncbi:response regulator transcription factor [Streptomyces sp. CG4]|uniref:response regulator n=1 Tax=Streptomyces sp. CG4 TaxID=408783 RepID=UPI0034E1D0CF
MSPTPISVIIADDHRVVREGLATILGAVDAVHVAGLAADGTHAVDLAALHEADVVLMDLHMPGMDGVEATRRLKAERPATAVVVLTTYTDDDSILAALEAGATGYLTKNASAADIHRAIEAAVGGHAMLDPIAAARLIRASRRNDPGHTSKNTALPDGLMNAKPRYWA